MHRRRYRSLSRHGSCQSGSMPGLPSLCLSPCRHLSFPLSRRSVIQVATQPTSLGPDLRHGTGPVTWWVRGTSPESVRSAPRRRPLLDSISAPSSPTDDTLRQRHAHPVHHLLRVTGAAQGAHAAGRGDWTTRRPTRSLLRLFPARPPATPSRVLRLRPRRWHVVVLKAAAHRSYRLPAPRHKSQCSAPTSRPPGALYLATGITVVRLQDKPQREHPSVVGRPVTPPVWSCGERALRILRAVRAATPAGVRPRGWQSGVRGRDRRRAGDRFGTVGRTASAEQRRLRRLGSHAQRRYLCMQFLRRGKDVTETADDRVARRAADGECRPD